MDRDTSATAAESKENPWWLNLWWLWLAFVAVNALLLLLFSALELSGIYRSVGIRIEGLLGLFMPAGPGFFIGGIIFAANIEAYFASLLFTPIFIGITEKFLKRRKLGIATRMVLNLTFLFILTVISEFLVFGY